MLPQSRSSYTDFEFSLLAPSAQDIPLLEENAVIRIHHMALQVYLGEPWYSWLRSVWLSYDTRFVFRCIMAPLTVVCMMPGPSPSSEAE